MSERAWVLLTAVRAVAALAGVAALATHGGCTRIFPEPLPRDAGLVFGAECKPGAVWTDRGHRYLCVDDEREPRAVLLLDPRAPPPVPRLWVVDAGHEKPRSP